MSQAHRSLVLLVLIIGALAWLWPAVPPNVVADGDSPVANAVVRIQGHSTAVLTDSRGHFFLPPIHRRSARVTAWKDGYGIGSASLRLSPLVVQLVPLPSADNDDYAWIEPSPDLRQPANCGNCHGEIIQEWSQSGHARAATN